MDNIHKCVYCRSWLEGTVYRGGRDIKRLCPVIRKKISADSYCCKYFNPKDSFFCDNNNCWLGFIVCLHRRRNPDKYKSYENCDNCRQFNPDIKDIVRDYYIDRVPVLESPKRRKRKLKRRSGRKRKLKRRKLKRRK